MRCVCTIMEAILRAELDDATATLHRRCRDLDALVDAVEVTAAAAVGAIEVDDGLAASMASPPSQEKSPPPPSGMCK